MGPTLLFSDRLHQEKYRNDNETFKEAMNRVAGALTDDNDKFHKFRDALLNMRFLPGGRIQSAIGTTKNCTAINCFVSSKIEDSFVDGPHSIMQTATEAAATMRMGGGVGFDFSTLRPRGDLIHKLNSYSTGPVSFMEIYNSICLCVASSGHRRGAMMGILRVDHPDIEEFIHAKQPPHESEPVLQMLSKCKVGTPEWYDWFKVLQSVYSLTGFNLSIAVTDKFMEAVKEGKQFKLKFKNRIYREIDARSLWDTIMRSTWDWAEPGILFIDTVNDLNNLHYAETIAASNPCLTGDTLLVDGDRLRHISERGETWDSWKTGTKRVIELICNNGLRIKCTPDHKIRLKDGTFIEAKDSGGKILEWGLGDRSPEEFIEKYILLGFLFGDGFLSGKKQGVGAKLTREKETEICELLEKYGFGHNKGGYYLNRKVLEESIGLSLSFLENTLPHRIIPDAIMTAGSNVSASFLRGLFEANGSAKTNGQVSFTTTCKKQAEQIQILLSSFGVISWITRHTPATITWKNGTYTSRESFRLQIAQRNVGPFRDNIGFYSTYKSIKLRPVDGSYKGKLKVVNIEELGEEEVWDFRMKEGYPWNVCNGIVAHNCAEQVMGEYGACLLGSFNLVKYLTKEDWCWSFDFDLLKNDIPYVVEAMDNVIDNSIFPLQAQKDSALNSRRMGLGVTGAANAIEAMGFSYGSPEFIETLDKILNYIKTNVYKASVELAKVKGPFPLFDKEQYMQGKFIQTLDEEVQELIAKHGIRNSHLTSIAPTGTISICADNVSSGIEPVFAWNQKRLVNMKNGSVEVDVDDYGVREFGVYGKRCSDVTVDEHLNVLITAAKHVDSAISKTCNVPPTTPWDEFKGIYMRAWEAGCKGITTFQTGGKRSGIIESADESACRIDPITGRHECE